MLPLSPRARLVILLASGVILVFALLGALQAFNTSGVGFLNPDTSGETLAFMGLTVLLFLLLVALLILLLRNLLKLYADQGSSAIGARLRTRMVLGALVIAFTPAVFMFLFSFFMMNRTIDRWFSPNTTEIRRDSTRVVQELAQYVTSNARVEAESITASGAPDRSARELEQVLESHRITLAGGFVIIFGSDGHVLASLSAPAEGTPASLMPLYMDEARAPAAPLPAPFSDGLLSVARRRTEPVIAVSGRQYAVGTSETPSGKLTVVALPMPEGLSDAAMRIRVGAANYQQLYQMRRQIRSNFFLLLLLVTVIVFFSSVWLALFLSKQITRPVAALADAMDAIAAGQYAQRVELVTPGEMGELVRSFNHMALDLETSRRLAESSSAQLKTANQALEERRREVETILETIPSGVVTLDADGVVLKANRGFAGLVGLPEEEPLRGKPIISVMPAECSDEITALIRRGRRMGAASSEIEVSAQGRRMHLAITSARLDLGLGKHGTVLVVEDTTELLRAQRQMAWKEVAQRVAHEIKNPLTPIALSAERIGKHLDRAQPDSPNVIRKCSEVILACVGTLRTLVDQFSALAQFPVSQPRACDINAVAQEALAMFAGRLEGITLEVELTPNLPPVLADRDAIRRAFANLIDNAAEAMQGSLLRVLCVTSALSEDGTAVEVTVSDTGHGLTDEIRERLFLPFYSTKRRGTGLGLSIAAKIAQEHRGSIRAESNTPKGARFVLRIPLVEPQRDADVDAGESIKEMHS